MLILDSTNKTLEFKLSGAVATSQIPVVISYVDKSATAYTPGEADTQSNGTNTVTILAAPAASVQREVKTINIANIDTAPVVVTLQLNNNATVRVLTSSWTLAVGDSLQWTDTEGWSSFTNRAEKKTTSNHGKTLLSVSGSLTADTDIVAAVAGRRIKVIAYSLISSGTNSNLAIFKSNGAAGTELWRSPLQSSTSIFAGANLAIAAPGFLFATVTGEKLTLDVSQTDTVHYSITYFTDDSS